MKNIKDFFTANLDKCITLYRKKISNPIFVLTGILPYVDISKYKDYITDIETFDVDGGKDVYTENWFVKFFATLSQNRDFHILSHQQYVYLTEFLLADIYADRTIVIYDNLRSYYPLPLNSYVENISGEKMDERPDGLPAYQADQIKHGTCCFYSLRKIDDKIKQIPFFTQTRELDSIVSEKIDCDVIDTSSDQFSCDFFLNDCIASNDFSKKLAVKVFKKNMLAPFIKSNLSLLNYILSLFGGGIYEIQENQIPKEYIASEASTSLLLKYWGDKAEFRNINIYENPDLGRTTIPISQGLIVDTIIKEYENGRKGTEPRDVFITAPTGAGKSLIFQLPSFYAAQYGDMTIVVSPLKALMKDQVIALHTQRNYHRVEYINSDLNLIDRDRIIEQCKDGNIDILYLSPELLLSYDIRYFIGERRLGLLIIDEAHLITTWGRDFRVDYWYLGNHVNKIRKFSESKFPLVALTATAVYGGTNDMVFDSINSLYMSNPHKFIGEVRRKDIEFVIDNHEEYSSGTFDNNKEEETLNFIKGVKELDLKTIVYAPFTKHVKKLETAANEIEPNMMIPYHGKMCADEQNISYQKFLENKCKIMVCTKAFGMGVDIPDIQVVYHHTPSGLIPDYIQEIGRVARKKDLKGYAALTFSLSDLKYSKQLFGISAIRNFQLREVIKKVYKYFESNGRKRNMLMSSNDFSFIFNDDPDLDQKVSSALMMIEKDYLIKHRFNVLIARPKRIFSKVFARIPSLSYNRLNAKYGKCCKEFNYRDFGDYHYVELDLEKIWSTYFSDKSFPTVKNEFYKQKLFHEDQIELIPLIKIIHTIEIPADEAYNRLQYVLDTINSVLTLLRSRGAFFTENEFKALIEERLKSKYDVIKLSKFILSTYGGRKVDVYHLETDSFLQCRRRSEFIEEYQVFNTNYEAKLSQLKTIFAKLYANNDKQKAIRYLSAGEIVLKNHIRLGSIIEIMGLGTFETHGGEDPKLFIRINDPRRIKFDSENTNYKNKIVESIKNRYLSSTEIFEHFFTNYLSNDTRWDFIEDFFLGVSNDELLEQYKGGTRNHIDIIEYLRNNAKQCETTTHYSLNYERVHNFPPKQGVTYYSNNYLTLEGKTHRLCEWMTNDPVLLHRIMVEIDFKIEYEYYKVLMNRLEQKFPLYYRDFMGLKMRIDFPGYDTKVQASVPYKDQPVKFYKWWKSNKNTIYLSTKEKIMLFFEVERIKPGTLNQAHLKMIKKH